MVSFNYRSPIRGITLRRILAAGIVMVLLSFFYGPVNAETLEAKQGEVPQQAQGSEQKQFFENFSWLEPVYFLYGWDPKNLKLQISFKYRFFNPRGPLATRWNWLTDFHFGYTQTSFADFKSSSRPFEDTSYMPEFLWFVEDIEQAVFSWISRLDFQTGIQHISNGQSGDDSRSLNIIYVKPVLAFGNVEKYHFTVAPKVWIYIGNISENPDIADYWGYFDLKLIFGKPDGLMLSTDLRKGTDSGKGSIQIDFTYPMNKILFGNLNGYFQAQLFSGYGEELLLYNQKDTRFRIGIGFSR